MITNQGHHGHMTWYILNIPDNIPSQDMIITSLWYILNILNMHWFGMVLVLHPRPCHVLAMYQVSTSPLAPSVTGLVNQPLPPVTEPQPIQAPTIGAVRWQGPAPEDITRYHALSGFKPGISVVH